MIARNPLTMFALIFALMFCLCGCDKDEIGVGKNIVPPSPVESAEAGIPNDPEKNADSSNPSASAPRTENTPPAAYEQWAYQNTFGNVAFDAQVYGMKSGSLSAVRCTMGKVGAQREQEVLKILEGTFLTAEDPVKRVKVEGVTGDWYRTRSKDREITFDDGVISLKTQNSYEYSPITDFNVLPYRLRSELSACGNLGFMTAEQAVEMANQWIEKLSIATEIAPFYIKAYSTDKKRLMQDGITPYIEKGLQGNVYADNVEAIQSFGPEVYLMHYRYMLRGVPCHPFSYYYLEGGGYADCGSLCVEINQDGVIGFTASNMRSVQEVFAEQSLIDVQKAIDLVADKLNMILGVEPYICKEISLEYVPVYYMGGDPQADADMVPAWVFYFEQNDPIIVNAIAGEIIETSANTAF